jgi:metal-dependent amidase/aminoacylase/carboxypeptidase family protein
MRAGALGADCDVEINWCGADYLDYKMNLPLADAYEANAQALGRTGFIPVENLPLGGTDMGNVSHRVPSLHPLICIAPRNVHIHDPAFAVWARSEKGNAAVLDGAKALAMTAIDVMTRPDLQSQIREDFAATAQRSRDAVSAVANSGANSKHAMKEVQ